MESQDIIFDLIYNAIKTKDRRQKLLFKDREFEILDSELYKIKDYLRTIPNGEKELIHSMVKEFNANQLAVLLETIRHYIKFEKPVNKMISEIKNIHKGLFPKYTNYKTEYTSGCLETYTGFIRALNSDTLYTTKLKINGKLKRVFIKTPIGHVNIISSNNQGFLSFVIDPETMKVYSYKFNENGTILDKSLEEVYNYEKYKKEINILYSEDSRKKMLNNYSEFRKELLNKIDAIYGIERIVDTFLRMGGKINPEKYSNPELKAELIEYLEEKFGTDKILKWASQIKDPQKVAELKLEILNILSKKFGEDYARVYNFEKRLAKNILKTSKIKKKQINIRRL